MFARHTWWQGHLIDADVRLFVCLSVCLSVACTLHGAVMSQYYR